MLQWGLLVLFAVRLYLILYTVACEYSALLWTINLCLSLHQTAEWQWHLRPRGYRVLQEAAKPAQDCTKRVYFSFSVWLLNDIGVFGKFSFAMDSRTRKSFWIFQSNGKKHAVDLLSGNILRPSPKLEKAVFAQEEDWWFIMHWNCLLSSHSYKLGRSKSPTLHFTEARFKIKRVNHHKRVFRMQPQPIHMMKQRN